MPVGTKVTLLKGETAFITQSLGGAHTVVVNGNMFRIDERDADALGLEVTQKPTPTTGQARTVEQVEAEAWTQLKTCYDPEIPVNIVDLGLIYDCRITPLSQPGRYQVTWSGRTERGEAPVGMYFVRYRTPGKNLMRRLVLSR